MFAKQLGLVVLLIAVNPGVAPAQPTPPDRGLKIVPLDVAPLDRPLWVFPIPKDSAEKTLTVIPLRKSDPRKAAEQIATFMKGRGHVFPRVEDRVLLLYADANTTRIVELSFAERDPTALHVPAVVKVPAGCDAEEVAGKVRKLFPDLGWIEVVPDDSVILLWASVWTIKDVREVVRAICEVLPRPRVVAQPARKPMVVPLKNVDPREAAKVLSEVFNGPGGGGRVIVVPIPEEKSLLIYATELDTRTLLKLLSESIDTEPAKPEKKYTVKFDAVPWGDALDWYSQFTGLTQVSGVKPKGTLTLIPPKDRQFTVGEITDLFNEALVQQKHIMVRREKTFAILPADEKIDPTLVPRVALNELALRGNTELVQLLLAFPAGVKSDDLASEIKKMLTPFGAVVSVQNKVLVLTDTAGNLRNIVTTLRKTPGVMFQEPDADPKKPAAEPKKMSFQMKNVPWADVLEWYVKESGLMPFFTVKPTGNFTFIPPKPDTKYTLAEITDILNEALASQKFILIRRQVSFTILPTDEKLDLSLIPRVELSGLDVRGKTELVQVLIPVKSLTVGDIAPEIKKLLTPFGSISVYKNTLIVTDTAGNLRTIWRTIQAVENATECDVLTHILRFKKAADVAEQLKPLLIDKDNTKKIAISVDEKTNSVTIAAPEAIIAKAKKFLEDIDKPAKGDRPPGPADPELRRYPVPVGTAEAVAKTLQTDFPKLRTVALPATNEVLFVGTPEEHLKVAETLKSAEKPKEPEKK